MIISTNTEMIKRETIEALCMRFQGAKEKILQAEELLKRANGQAGEFSCYRASIECGAENAIKEMKSKFWRHIMKHTGIQGIMSIKDREKMSNELWNNKELPDIMPDQVWGLVSKLTSDIPEMLNKAIKEVFELLTPQKRRWGDNYKTNDEFTIGKKVILTNIIDGWDSHVNYSYGEPKLNALENVLMMLDGKGPLKGNKGKAVLAINDSHVASGEINTEYMKIKWFKNRNAHLEFKRMDLIKELNERAGGNKLHQER